MSSAKITVVFPAITFALMGAFLSAIVLVQHGQSGPVDNLLASRWATFPPLPDVTTPSHGLPVALIGVVYFVGLTLWLIVVGRLSWRQRLWHSLPMAVALLGGLVSVAMIAGLMVLEAWCPLCLAVHAMNLVLAAYVYLCRPERGANETDDAPAEMRPVLSGLALAGCAGAAVWFGWESFLFRQQNQELSTALARASAVAEPSADETPVESLTPAPAEDAASPTSLPPSWLLTSTSPDAVTVVIFTDLLSAECRALAQRLLDEIAPQFGGNLRLAVKHFPLCAACNSGSNDVHPGACEAAYLAEAGRQQGGAAAFLRVVDSISLDRAQPWSDEDVIRLALDLGLNPQKFAEDWQNTAIRRRVTEDVALALQLGVVDAPTVYVNGQKLDPRLRDHSPYWKQLAARVRPAERPAAVAVAAIEPPPGIAPLEVIEPLDAQSVTATVYPVPARDPAEEPPLAPLQAPKPVAKSEGSPFETTPAPVLAQGLIKRYDLNSDGILQPPEYAKIPGDFAKYDTNQDGDVSAEELSAAIAIAQRAKQSAPQK